MKKIILVPALIGVMGIGGLIAVAGNNTFDAASEPVVTIVEESNTVSESNNTELKLNQEQSVQKKLSVEEIEKKALALVDGDGAVITDLEFEREGQWSHYEVEVHTNEAEYELKLDAFTGKLLEKEVDRHDDNDDFYDEVYDDDFYADGYDDDRYED